MAEGTPEHGRRLMDQARDEARRLRHAAIDVGHILLALCAEGGDEVEAFLRANQLDAASLKKKILDRLPPGPSEPPAGEMPYTPEAREVLDAAVESASSLGHPSLRPVHLWMGIVARPRGIVAEVLGAKKGWEARLRKILRSQMLAWPRTIEVLPDSLARTTEERRALLSRVRITDSHVHVQPWAQMSDRARSVMEIGREDLETIDRTFADPQAFLGLLDEQGVHRAALINYVSPEVMGFTEEVNRFVGEFCRAAPERLVAFGGVDPRDQSAVDEKMDRLVGEFWIRGIKIHPPHQGYASNAYVTGDVPGLAKVYEKAQEAGLVVMIHTGTSIFRGARSRLGNPMDADDIAVDFPELKIILAHGGRPIWMDAAFFLVRRHPNVYMDLSSIPPRKLLDYFPRLSEISRKVLFGTDWPAPGVESIRKNLEEFATLPLPDEAFREILQENPDAVFGTPGA